jgi:hypothetical protein
MKAYIFSFYLVALSYLAVGQKSPIIFGEIPLQDLKMTTYDADSSASAVILSDYGHSYISINAANVDLRFERHVRIKILRKVGLHWADIQIPLYYNGSTEERISALKASSYNLESGRVVETKMSREGTAKEKVNKRFKLLTFTIPNVKEGSVVEFSYTMISDFFWNFPEWQFQYTIPVRHSEYWAFFPDFYTFEKYMQGYLTITDYKIETRQQGTFQFKAHHWRLQNVPAFKEEPYMTSSNDYVSKIFFAISHVNYTMGPTVEIMGSWKKLNELLLKYEYFGDLLNENSITNNTFLNSIVKDLLAGKTDPMEKVRTIYSYIQQNLEWDGFKDFVAGPLKKVFESKKGSSGDINLALGCMLKKAGIDCDMILLSTRDHGFIRKNYPMDRQFNYVVVGAYIDGVIVLLDATEKYLPVNILPERCLNGEGLIISNARHGWIDLPPKAKSKTVILADLTLHENGDLKGKLNYVHDGYDAQRMRKDYTAKGEDSYIKTVVKPNVWQIEKSEFLGVNNISETSQEKYQLSIQEHASIAGDLVYINPFVTAQLEANPFTLESREYPVDFGSPIEKTYVCKLTIPSGFSVDEMPATKAYVLPGNAGKYLISVTGNANVINITSTLMINKKMFTQDEYPALREFYSHVVAKQAEQIVLKKN